jgi:hypothetical protein
MVLVMKSEMPPPRTPKRSWFIAVEEKRAPSRARRPSEADEKIKKPTTTRTIERIISTRSIDDVIQI